MKKERVIKNILGPGMHFSDRYVEEYEELRQIVSTLKNLGYSVVLTQGVFDLIHKGHGKYLEEAKRLGDVLIVGLDSDALTRERKGPTRPIVPQDERAEMLMHLRHVDIVVLRDVGVDMNELIRVVEPDVLVVSQTTKDFPVELQEELASYYGRRILLPPQAETSTTARRTALLFDGANKLGTQMKQKMQEAIDEYLAELEGGQS